MPSDKLESSSVMNSVVDKLFVECFNRVFVLVLLKWCWCGNVQFWSIQPGLGDVPCGQ